MRRLIALFTALSLFASSIAALADGYRLPNLGSSADAVMTPAEETRLGEAFMRRIRATGRVIDEPWAQAYLHHLGQRLAAHDEAVGQHFHFFLLDEPTINAFAGPAGHIGVHSGLVLATRDESELAAVLSHEIAHVTQHHLAQFYADAKRLSIPGAALLIASVLLGAVGGAQAGIAAAVGGQAAILQHQIDFTRANEKEADAIGIEILADAGFDPSAMASFFSRLGKATRLYNTKLPKFLLTHPVSSERIAEAQGRARRFRYHQASEDPRFHLLRAWLRVRADDDPEALVPVLRRQLADGSYRSQTAKRFELALALEQAGKTGQAIDVLRKITAERRAQPAIAVTLARFLAHRKQLDEAARVLQKALRSTPDNRPLLIAQARLDLRRGHARAALAALRRLLERTPDDATLLKLQARALDARGERIEAELSLAEAYFQQGDTEAAIQQLRIAKREFPHLDYYLAARIEARQDAYQQEQDELDTH